MQVVFALVVLMVCGVSGEIRASRGAGRVAMWRPAASSLGKDLEPSYFTASLFSTDLAEHIREHTTPASPASSASVSMNAVTVVLRSPSSQDSVLSVAGVRESLRQSPAAHIVTDVYGAQDLSVVKAAQQAQQVPSTPASIEEAVAYISSRDVTESAAAASVLDVMVSSSPQDASALQALHRAAAKLNTRTQGKVRVLFLAVDECTAATAPASSASYLSAHEVQMQGQSTARRLSSSSGGQRRNETGTDTAREARSAGTEFSIYHSGNYLYMTPVILTGYITGGALLAIVLVGLSCTNDLSNTQDMSWTDEKGIPAIGREA